MFFIAVALLSRVALPRLRRFGNRRRRRFITQYRFPPELSATLRDTWPDWKDWQIDAVERALRTYFIAHLDAGPQAALAMPSKAADELWHAFVLDTRAYHQFCYQAFGGYFHHVPAYRMSTRPSAIRHGALERIWRESCRQTGIDPDRPDRLPLLFQLDGVLKLPDAQRYDLARMGRRSREWRKEVSITFGCGGGGGCSGSGSDCCGDGGCGGGCGGD